MPIESGENVILLLANDLSQLISCQIMVPQSKQERSSEQVLEKFEMQVRRKEIADGTLKELYIVFRFSNPGIYFPSLTVEHPDLGSIVGHTKAHGKGVFTVLFSPDSTNPSGLPLDVILMRDSRVKLRLCN